MGRISAIVLAAGSSRRMGADKLSLPWGDGTVLDAALRPFLGLPEIDEVVVVVRGGAAPLFAPGRATVLVNEKAVEKKQEAPKEEPKTPAESAPKPGPKPRRKKVTTPARTA